MKNKIVFVYVSLIVAALILGCSRSSKEKNKNITAPGSITLHDDDKYFAIDTIQSTIAWKGSNTFGSHKGYVHISKGELMIENGELTGGAVEVNMSTIEDDAHLNTSGLIKHLKDADFFDVKKFPLTTIAITKVASINAAEKEITADLVIKNIMHPVTFPATVEIKNGTVKANGRLVIDRTDWGIRYKSGKFFDLLADQSISDSIEFEVSIVARNDN